MFQTQAQIVDRVELEAESYFLDCRAPEIASTAEPGQFVMVRVSDGLDPLLRRPLSIHQVSEERFGLLFRTAGKGTALLSRKRIGAWIDVVGPLGRGFRWSPGVEEVLLVAGGRGVAPLLFLAQRLAKETPPPKMRLLYGTRTKSEIVRTEPFKALGVEVLTATEDGTEGYHGMVTDLPPSLISQGRTAVFACGPTAMFRALSSAISDPLIPVQVSMEAHMSCGLGACRGCVVKSGHGYAHVCQDGPVFAIEDLNWEEDVH